MMNLTMYYLTLRAAETSTNSSQFSVIGENVFPYIEKDVQNLPTVQYLANSKYGKCTSMNSKYACYISTNERKRILDRYTVVSIDSLSHQSETTELLFCPTSEYNHLLASCDASGTVQIVNVVKGEQSIVLQSTEIEKYSNLCWKPNHATLAATCTDNNVYLWNAESLLANSSFEVVGSNGICILLPHQAAHLSFDIYSNLFVASARHIFQIKEGSILQQYNVENLDEREKITAVYSQDGYFIIATSNNSHLYVLEENSEDSGSLRITQEIYLNSMAFQSLSWQISFVPTLSGHITFIVTCKESPIIRILHFSTNNGCFTFHEEFTTGGNNIIHHSVSITKEDKIELFCHLDGGRKHTFSVLTYSPHYSDFPLFNSSQPPLVVEKAPYIESQEKKTEITELDKPQVQGTSKETSLITEKPLTPKKKKSKRKKKKKEEKDLTLDTTGVNGEPTVNSNPSSGKTTPRLDNSQQKSKKAPKKTSSSQNIKITAPSSNKPEHGANKSKQNSKNLNIDAITKAGSSSKNESDIAVAMTPNVLHAIESQIQNTFDSLYEKISREQVTRENKLYAKLNVRLRDYCRKQAAVMVAKKMQAVEEMSQKIESIVMDEISDRASLVKMLRAELYDHFSVTLGPAIEQTFRGMYQQISESFENGIENEFQTLHEATSEASAMQCVVDDLSLVCNELTGEMAKPLYRQTFQELEVDVEEEEEEEEEITPVQLIEGHLNSGDYSAAFEEALKEEGANDLLFMLLGLLEGSDDWHGSVSVELLVKILLRISGGPKEQISNLLRWMKNLLEHMRYSPENGKVLTAGYQPFVESLRNLLQGITDPNIHTFARSCFVLSQEKLLPPSQYPSFPYHAPNVSQREGSQARPLFPGQPQHSVPPYFNLPPSHFQQQAQNRPNVPQFPQQMPGPAIHPFQRVSVPETKAAQPNIYSVGQNQQGNGHQVNLFQQGAGNQSPYTVPQAQGSPGLTQLLEQLAQHRSEGSNIPQQFSPIGSPVLTGTSSPIASPQQRPMPTPQNVANPMGNMTQQRNPVQPVNPILNLLSQHNNPSAPIPNQVPRQHFPASFPRSS